MAGVVVSTAIHKVAAIHVGFAWLVIMRSTIRGASGHTRHSRQEQADRGEAGITCSPQDVIGKLGVGADEFWDLFRHRFRLGGSDSRDGLQSAHGFHFYYVEILR